VIASIPSPSSSGLSVGPLEVHFYGLMYVLAVLAAVLITVRRWEARGGSRETVYDVAIWGFPAGLIGGRLYFDITSWGEVPAHWWGPFAVWEGGLGIWGGIAAGTVVGIWRLRRAGVSVAEFMDAAAPALLVAQAIGRLGNYFNQELFGGPTSLPWAIEIAPATRPDGYAADATFHPTFLYEMLWNLSLAAFLVWLGNHRSHPTPGAVRALRHRLLGFPHRRGAAAGRPGSAHPRAAAQLLRRHAAHGRRRDLVRPHSGLATARATSRGAVAGRGRGRSRRLWSWLRRTGSGGARPSSRRNVRRRRAVDALSSCVAPTRCATLVIYPQGV